MEIKYLDPKKTSTTEMAKRMGYGLVRDNAIVAICSIPVKIALKDKFSFKSALIGITMYDIFEFGCVVLCRNTSLGEELEEKIRKEVNE